MSQTNVEIIFNHFKAPAGLVDYREYCNDMLEQLSTSLVFDESDWEIDRHWKV